MTLIGATFVAREGKRGSIESVSKLIGYLLTVISDQAGENPNQMIVYGLGGLLRAFQIIMAEFLFLHLFIVKSHLGAELRLVEYAIRIGHGETQRHVFALGD